MAAFGMCDSAQLLGALEILLMAVRWHRKGADGSRRASKNFVLPWASTRERDDRGHTPLLREIIRHGSTRIALFEPDALSAAATMKTGGIGAPAGALWPYAGSVRPWAAVAAFVP